MVYFIYILLLKIIFFFHKTLNPAGALPPDFNLISKQVIPTIEEASGMADSKNFPGHLWVHEDSGNRNELYLLAYSGKVKRKVLLQGVKNRDWEDMALVGNDIFIADTGDNKSGHKNYYFYRFPEPGLGIDTVKNIQKIRFEYPDGPHDAEAFLVDPKTQDIYIINKRNQTAFIYLLAAPYNLANNNQVKLVGKLGYTGVVSAAMSADGKQIIIKTYTNLYRYTHNPGESILVSLQKSPKSLPYQVEPQGEAISFALDNSGLFTLSEKGFDFKVMLYFYPF